MALTRLLFPVGLCALLAQGLAGCTVQDVGSIGSKECAVGVEYKLDRCQNNCYAEQIPYLPEPKPNEVILGNDCFVPGEMTIYVNETVDFRLAPGAWQHVVVIQR